MTEHRFTSMILGVVIGSLLFLHFTLIFSPGKWLFASLPFSSAIILFGDIGMAWIAVCAAIGYFIGKRKDRKNEHS